MNFLKYFSAAVLLVLFLCSGVVAEPTVPPDATAPATAPAMKKVAIFVKNRADKAKVPDEKVKVLEDLVVGRITDLGLSIISREDVINSVAKFADAGPNAGDPNDPAAKLDALMSNQTSALRLAQNMGADYIIVPSITSFGMDKAVYKGETIQTTVTEYKMRVTYKLLNCNEGGSLTADVIEATKRFMENAQLQLEADIVNDLLNEASIALADVLKKKVDAKKIPEMVADKKFVKFRVVASMADMNFPEIIKDKDGEYIATANRYKLDGLAATVEIDGVTLGTTEGEQFLAARPGLSKIRVSRPDCRDYAQTINIREGLLLNVPMQFTDEGRARWIQNTRMFNDLKAGQKLNDAQVKVYEGLAQMLRQSGNKVDTTQPSDPKINIFR